MNNISVVVMTSDGFDWVWEGWAHWFKKHWCFDLPWKIYFVTETKDCPVDFAEGIKIGHGDWTERVDNAIRQIPQDMNDSTIFFMLEDYWLRHPVNPNMFMDLAETFFEYDMDCLRVCFRCVAVKTEITDILVGHEPLWKITPDSPYRFSTQASFWKRDTFTSCLLPNKDIWQQERKGSRAMAGKDYRLYKYNLDWYANAVSRGKFDTRDEFVDGYLKGQLT